MNTGTGTLRAMWIEQSSLLLLKQAKKSYHTRIVNTMKLLTASAALLCVSSLSAGPAEAFVVAPQTATAVSSLCKARPSSAAASSFQLRGFLGNFFETLASKNNASAGAVVAVKKPVYETVVIDQDFRVARLFLALGVALDFVPYIQWTLGPLVTALGFLFLVQSFRIRFVFDDENCLELKTALRGSAATELGDSGENPVVGGANRWSCDTIVNYDFFPKAWMENPNHPVGPVLVYFKETQTDESFWADGPGKSANDPEKIAAGTAVGGQVHFFPAVCNAQQIKAEFEKRGCGKLRVE